MYLHAHSPLVGVVCCHERQTLVSFVVMMLTPRMPWLSYHNVLSTHSTNAVAVLLPVQKPISNILQQSSSSI